METKGDQHERSQDEADVFRRSKRRFREPLDEFMDSLRGNHLPMVHVKETAKVSYKDKVVGRKDRYFSNKMEEVDDGLISDDDLVEKGDGKTWFRMGMTREEKIKARRPWCNNMIIGVVGRPVGYHYLWRQIKMMWRTQMDPLLIDVGNESLIIKLTSMEECVRVLCDGPWMVGENYPHVRRWRPNFIADAAKIYSFPVSVHFPILPMK